MKFTHLLIEESYNYGIFGILRYFFLLGGTRMKAIKLLIIEDENSLTEILRLYLEREGFTVYSALNASNGLQLMMQVLPDILLLDINLPDQCGFELARKYRDVSDGILFFITGEKTKTMIIKGFELGCDDYITKPFDPPELIARIKANIRRSGLHSHTPSTKTYGNITINFSDMSVYKAGSKIELFTKEKMLLFYLVQHPNQVFSTEQLYEQIWGYESEADLKTVHVHISTLRKKIEDQPRKPLFIQTVRGFGYKFSSTQSS